MWVPVPGIGAGILTPEGNFASYIDRQFLPGSFCCFDLGDNEGLLSTLPAICSSLLGVFAGHWLRSENHSKTKRGVGPTHRGDSLTHHCPGLESFLSHQQTTLEQFLCPLRGRMEPSSSGKLLSGHRCVGMQEVGIPFCGHRDERPDHLHRPRTHRFPPHLGVLFRRDCGVHGRIRPCFSCVRGGFIEMAVPLFPLL